MRNSAFIFSVLALGIATIGSKLSAVPITYIFTGAGSGSLGGVSFDTSNFTITGISDTTDVQNNIGIYSVDNISASIDISGLGTFDIETGTREFLSGDAVGFSRATFSGLDLYDGPTNSALSGWTMQTSIGPLPGDGSLIQWTDTPEIETNAGQLIFNSGGSDVTFQAIVGSSGGSPVPDNSSTMIMVTCVMMVLGFFRRRLAA
jgi:hypothetical protein